MRQAAKVDDNQAAIVEALRSLGASVESLAAVGKGVPDLLVGFTVADIDGDGDADIIGGSYSRGPRGEDGEGEDGRQGVSCDPPAVR